jgi:hypothetical protein
MGEQQRFLRDVLGIVVAVHDAARDGVHESAIFGAERYGRFVSQNVHIVHCERFARSVNLGIGQLGYARSCPV